MGNPLVSIIFAVHNNEHSIARCLEYLHEQDYESTKLIVVDDCSTDNTPQIIQDNLQRFSSYCYIRNEKQMGEARSLNKGIEASEGEFIYFIASDIYTERNSLSEAVRFLQNQPEHIVAIMGSLYNYDRGYWSMVRHAAQFGGYQKKRVKQLVVFALCNVLVRRKVLTEGDRLPNNTRSTDVEFSTRLREQGYSFLYFPKLKAWHDHPHSWASYIRLMRKGARGYVETRTHNPRIHYNFIKNSYVFLALLPFLPIGATIKKVINGNQRDILLKLPILIPAMFVGQMLFWYYVLKGYSEVKVDAMVVEKGSDKK